MYLKKIQDDDFNSVGYKMKLVFKDENEYEKFYKEISNSFSGFNSLLSRSSGELLDYIESNYIASDSVENGLPSTIINTFNTLAQMLPLFFYLLQDKGISNAQQVDLSQYVKLSDYDDLKAEYDKLSVYIGNTNNSAELAQVKEENANYKEQLSEANSKIDKLSQQAKSANDVAEGYHKSILKMQESNASLQSKYDELINNLQIVKPSLKAIIENSEYLKKAFIDVTGGDAQEEQPLEIDLDKVPVVEVVEESESYEKEQGDK